MFKQLAIFFLILALIPGVAEAKRKPIRRNYKGDYKGEMIAPPPPEPLPVLAPCNNYSFNAGAYLGLGIGVLTNYNRTPAAYKGAEGSFFAGYGMMSSNYYLAAELFAHANAQLQNYNSGINAAGFSTAVRSTWSYGISMLPGYLITDNVLAYFRIGVARTHFGPAGGVTGGQGGFGLQTSIGEIWDLRGEYTYSFYQSNIDPGPPHPLSDQYTLALLYKF